MESEDRIERLLALLLLQTLTTQRDKAVQLSIAGFTNSEIADLLQTNANVVGQRLHEARRGAKKKGKKKSAKKK